MQSVEHFTNYGQWRIHITSTCRVYNKKKSIIQRKLSVDEDVRWSIGLISLIGWRIWITIQRLWMKKSLQNKKLQRRLHRTKHSMTQMKNKLIERIWITKQSYFNCFLWTVELRCIRILLWVLRKESYCIAFNVVLMYPIILYLFRFNCTRWFWSCVTPCKLT